MHEKELSVKIKCHIKSGFQVIGIAAVPNGCCPDRPVLITANRIGRESEYINYSCQCSCDGWCTTGCASVSEALREWEKMAVYARKSGGYDPGEGREVFRIHELEGNIAEAGSFCLMS